MKKVVLGCLGALVITAIAAGILGYIFIVRPARSYVASVSELGELGDIEAQIRNKTPFTEPADGVISPEMMSRFITVQRAVKARLGPRFETLKQKYDEIEREHREEGRDASFTEALGAIQDLTTLLVEVRRAQVEALNASNLSLDEYRWLRTQVYAAANIVLPASSVSDLIPAAEGEATQFESVVPEVVPEQNRELVAPHAKELEEWVALWWFGL